MAWAEADVGLRSERRDSDTPGALDAVAMLPP